MLNLMFLYHSLNLKCIQIDMYILIQQYKNKITIVHTWALDCEGLLKQVGSKEFPVAARALLEAAGYYC